LYGEAYVDSASLMTPIPTTLSGVGPATAHPFGDVTLTAHVSPPPKWGYVSFRYVGPALDMVAGQGYPDENGDVSISGGASIDVGSYEIDAEYHAYGRYVGSTGSSPFEVTPYPSSTALAISPSPAPAFTEVTLTASVTSSTIANNNYPVGNVEFYDNTTGTPVLLGTTALVGQSIGLSKAILKTSSLAVGARSLFAKFVGPDSIRAGSTSAPVPLSVDAGASFVNLGLIDSPPIETHHSFQLTASIGAGNDQWAQNATMTFRRVGISTPICTVAVDPTNDTRCTVPSQAVGSWQYTATYSGNSQTTGSTSSPLALTIISDTVHATGVSLQYTTFYPVADSYKDTVAIKGTRNEPISVAIKIYNPAGTLYKSVTIASGTGAYSYAWNGRNSAGTIFAEGKYKVVQTLKDSAGTTLTSTLYVTLSKKKIYTYTKTIAYYGSTVTAKGTSGTGTLSINTTSHYALLKAGSAGWAGVGWEFTLPSATIYKSMKFQVDAKSGFIGAPAQIGMQNFSLCPYTTGTDWNTSCFDRWIQIGNATATTAWYTTWGSITTNRYGTHARGTLSVQGGTVYAYKVQVVVTYGILKY
jgi:flagellar hook assembly protein FlgD